MKYFLNLTLLAFILLIIFNITRINYNYGLTTDPNDKYFYSILFATLGILLIFIMKGLKNLSQTK
ncbi:hypothetical protein Ga0061079_101204 [Apibacter mensalis]|uniref:Uncharacterized protein n=1 Tax=Apibacter mensalis TaxID=1586267 RepID=A0A0X3ALY7_9FLAO|nr:hypothetical protein Ga0061079_101204 [Apibacter mensalis]